MWPLSPNLSTAQKIDDFHEQEKKNEWIKWADYETIQNIEEKDIPELKRYLDREINRIYAVQNNPDGSPRTLEQKDAEAVSWKRYLNSVNTLEISWRSDALQVHNHHQETYVATTEKTRAKLKELFGEVEKLLNDPISSSNNGVSTGIPSPTIEITPILPQDIIVTGPVPAVLPTQDSHQPPQRIERKELSDMEIFERNKKYITDHKIGFKTSDGIIDEKIQWYLEDPTRENIKQLQRLIKYPGKPDGIMGPITEKSIIDFLWKKESRDQVESLPISSKIGFSREWWKVALNARDKAGNIIQKLSYEEILKLAREWNSKMNETQKWELNQLILLSTIGDIWAQAASKDMDSMLFWSFRSGGKEEYKKQIVWISEYITGLQAKFQKWESIQADIYDSYSKFDYANTSTGWFTPPIAINDLRKALDIVQSDGSLDARRASILKTLSSKFDATTTGAVKSTAMLDIMNMKEMNDGNKKLNDAQWLTTLIDKPSTMWVDILKQDLGLTQDQAYTATKSIRDIVKGVDARKEEIKKNLQEQGVTSGFEDRIKWAKANSVSLILAEALVDGKISILSGSAVEAYKQAKGDLTWNKAIDISVQMAISLVPMGVGLLAARWAMAVGRGAMAMRVGSVVPNIAKWKVWAFVWASAIEGVGFYEWFNLTNNLIHNQDSDNKLGGAFEWWSDTKEIVKSIAMVWVIKSLGMIPGQRIETAILKDSTKMQKFAFEAGKVSGISLAVVGTSQWVEAMFGEGFHPTPEEYAQAVIMTALFRKFGGKNKKAESSNLPDWYELTPITSRKWINIVRRLQRKDPSYKPEIVWPKGEVLVIESIQWKSGSERLQTSNKMTWETGEITVSEFISWKYRRLDISSTSWEGKIGKELSRSPSKILEDVSRNKLWKNEKIFVNKMKTAINDIDTMDIKTLQAARGKINDLGGESFLEWRIKENSPTVKVWESLLESIDIRIALKTPKQSFTDITSARKWIAEHPKTATAGILLAIGGVTYKLIIDKQWIIKIQEAPEAWTWTINLPQDVATVATITPVAVWETTITSSSNASAGTISVVK